MCFFPFESQPTIIFTAIKIAVNRRLITKLINIRHDVGIPFGIYSFSKDTPLKTDFDRKYSIKSLTIPVWSTFFIVTESR